MELKEKHSAKRWITTLRTLMLALLMGLSIGQAYANNEEDHFTMQAENLNITAFNTTATFWVCYFNDSFFDSYVNSDIDVYINNQKICTFGGLKNTESTNMSSDVFTGLVNYDSTHGQTYVEISYRDCVKSGNNYWTRLYVKFKNVAPGETYTIKLGADYVPNLNNSRYQNTDTYTIKVNDDLLVKDSNDYSIDYTGPYSMTFHSKLATKPATGTKVNLVTTYTNGIGVMNASSGTNTYSKLPIPKQWTYYGDFFWFQNKLNAFYEPFHIGSCSFDSDQLDDLVTLQSNYNPVTLKPRVYALNREEKTMAMDDWNPTPILHFIRPTGISLLADNWDRSVTLTWKSEYIMDDQLRYNGEWVVSRSADDGKTWTFLQTLYSDYTNYKQTHNIKFNSDESLEYEKKYIYRVSFVPEQWTDYQGKITADNFEAHFYAKDLSAEESMKFDRDFAIDLQTVVAGSKVTLNWTTPSIRLGGREFKILRCDEENGTYSQVGQIAATKGKSEFTWSETLTDITTTYFYRVVIDDIMDATFDSGDPVGATSEEHTTFNSFEATKGLYDSSVRLEWSVKQVGDRNTQYLVSRRGCGAQDAESQDNWTKIYTCYGTGSNYSYTDQNASNGVFYEYKVESWTPKTNDPDKRIGLEAIYAYGFPTHTGQVSGVVNFEGGTAVDSVRVTLKPVSEEGEELKTYALHIDGRDGGLLWETTAAKFKKYFEKQWTTQFYVYPKNVNSEGSEIMQLGKFKLLLGQYDAVQQAFALNVADDNGTHALVGGSLPADEYSSLTLAYSNGSLTATIIHDSGDIDAPIIEKATAEGLSCNVADQTTLVVGGALDPEEAIGFNGFIDDVRVYGAKTLNEREITNTYDHMLSGKESKLIAYWTMDEGLALQKEAYDYSMTAGDPNNNHAVIRIANSNLQSGVLPNENLLALRALTDENGNYTVNGIPYFNGGSTYRVIPTKGIHEFEPASVTRYFSKTSSIFNGTDFKDKSSFPVSGVVYYENTNYPVEGASILVDGYSAVRDNAVITTDANGKFEINVPIGMHAISISQQGHTYVNEGRYPSTPNEKRLIDREITGLTFWDNTMVTVAGRIVGGTREYKKPLGFGNSNNNIGQAIITLKTNAKMNALQEVNGTHVEFVDNTEERVFEEASNKITTSAIAGAGNKSNTITIKTDVSSGEFAVKLPPVVYTVESINIPSNEKISLLENGVVETLDLTDTNITYKDSLQTGKGYSYFEYAKNYSKAYRSTPTLDLFQRGIETDGLEEAFGDETTAFVEEKVRISAEGKEEIYSDSTIVKFVEPVNGKPHYKFGYPVYANQLSRYTFDVRGYEKYVNYDDKTNLKEDRVPLDSVIVTFTNEMAAGNYVKVETGELEQVIDGKLELDTVGRGVYAFDTGIPRITAPYTLNMKVTYTVAGVNYEWKAPGFADGKFKAYLLGQKTNGNNFITAGPDELTMVLRDPPGSRSYMSWTKGTSHTYTKKRLNTHTKGVGLKTNFKWGLNGYQGVVIGGYANLFKLEATHSLNTEFTENHVWVNGKTEVWTSTANKTISTSADPNFDGTPGDVYIGHSTNTIFGQAQEVGLHKEENGEFSIGVETVNTIGQSFATDFQYTEYYIENTLIPNYEKIRNGLILPKGSPEVNNKPYFKYISLVDNNDPNFGTDTLYYKAIRPNADLLKSTDFPIDSVNHYNQQIALWKNHIKLNEQQKVKCINDRSKYLVDNLSISSGVSVNKTASTSYAGTKHDTDKQSVGNNTDYTWITDNPMFFTNLVIKGNYQYTYEGTDDNTDGNNETFAYTVTDGDINDAITLDVFDAQDSFSPIFVTRAGQTSGNYEPQRLTKYYKPGTEIMAATMKNYVPKIYSKGDDYQVNIPTNQPAQFHLTLANESETDVPGLFTFKLFSSTNEEGVNLKINDGSMNSGAGYLIKPGTPIDIMVEASCLDKDSLDVDLTFILVDNTQTNPIGPFSANCAMHDVHVSFVPAASEISLKADHPILNADSDKKVRFTVSDYNLSLGSLRNIGIQYRSEGDTQWHEINEAKWRCNSADSSTDGEVLSESSVEYLLDMHDNIVFPDNTYYFRAVAKSQFGTQILYGYSDEVIIIKDVQVPLQLGNYSPSNGTYTYNSEVSVAFNEDIVASALNLANGDVTLLAQKNNIINKGAHPVSLMFDGENSARSEARVSTPEGSMAIDLWVKAESDGNLMAFGTENNNMSFGIDEGKLYVNIGNQTEKSTLDVPLDDWIFLSLNLDRQNSDDAKLSATCATTKDNKIIKLIDNATITENFTTSANVFFGSGFKGNMHDVTVWDTARDWEIANSEKWMDKNQYTTHLVAYWPLTDGHGTVAEEKVSAYNLVLTDANAWALQNENYALRLEKGNYAAINTALVGSDDNSDYLLQMWFRADKDNTENAEVFNLNNGKTRVCLNGTDGSLTFESNDIRESITTNDLRDEKWHHISMQVRKSQNANAVIYLDGDKMTQMQATKVVNLDGELKFGKGLAGYFDDVRIWKGYYSSDIISDSRYMRLSTESTQIAGYYPMEASRLGDGNQLEMYPTLANKGIQENTPDIVIFTEENGNAEKVDAEYVVENLLSTAVAPQQKDAPIMQDVKFNLVTSKRKVLLDITENPANIEGCKLFAKVKNIKDKAGNTADPITWSFTVNHRFVEWLNQGISAMIDKSYDSEEIHTLATMRNNTGNEQSWTLSGVPEWMEPSSVGGTLSANEDFSIDFIIKDNVSIGTHNGNIYLVESNGISHKLPYNINVMKDVPEWTVNSSAYKNSMNIYGEVEIDNVVQENPYSIIAAFDNKDNCVGVAKPTYYPRYDAYYLVMTIFGNEAQTTPLRFRYYNATTGIVHPDVETSEVVTFAPNKVVGDMKNPFIWYPTNKIEQNLNIDYGWNWISFNVKLEGEDAAIEKVFNNAAIEAEYGWSQFDEVDNEDQTAIYENGTWYGDLKTIKNGTMYKVNATMALPINKIGMPMSEEGQIISINPNWNWLGANVSNDLTLTQAFADMNPTELDVIKSKEKVAIFSEKAWDGTLSGISPGVGYFYRNQGAAKTFTYPTSATLNRSKSVVMKAPAKTAYDYSEYTGTMVVVAVVESEGKTLPDCSLYALDSEGEVRGYKTSMDEDGNHLIYLVVHGDDAETISFRVEMGQGEDAQTYNFTDMLTFADGKRYGMPSSPYVFSLEATGVSSINGDTDAEEIYTVSGIRVQHTTAPGVYISNGKKVIRN